MLIAPFTYEQLNAHMGQIPQSFIHVHNTEIARFFKRYLLMDALAVFEWTLPEHWDADYFRYLRSYSAIRGTIRIQRFLQAE